MQMVLGQGGTDIGSHVASEGVVMTETITEFAHRLGYQATFTSRGVRLRKAPGHFVLFKNEQNCTAYLKHVKKQREKERTKE